MIEKSNLEDQVALTWSFVRFWLYLNLRYHKGATVDESFTPTWEDMREFVKRMR